MSKAHRGKGIKDNYNRGRGTCPVCKKTGLKVVYEQEVEGVKQSICKRCRAQIENNKRNAVAQPAPQVAETASEDAQE